MLSITELSVTYANNHEALKSISFEANKSEIIAIIGRSGAGKSTLLRTINGSQKVTSGKVLLDGEEISTLSGPRLQVARRQIGFVWQEFNLVERISALSNVLTGRLGYNKGIAASLGYFSRADREIALRSLERVNLLQRATSRADRLSGGEKQRVSIARAIAQEPKLLLADEPVASLDPELAAQVMADLARVARELGVLTLINIHQVELAREYCDRIIGIAQGVIAFDGKPAELTMPILDKIYRFDQPVLTPNAAPEQAKAPQFQLGFSDSAAV